MSESPVQAFRHAILTVIGHAPDVIEPGRMQRFATSDKRTKKPGWCWLFDDLRGGIYGDFSTGVSEKWTAECPSVMTRAERAHLARQVAAATAQREREQRARWKASGERNSRVLSECRRLTAGDPVTPYLKRRGLGELRVLPDCLLFHPALPYWHEGVKIGDFTAMVAPLIAPSGRMVALHCTYLTDDGRKADVPTVKKLTRASGPLAGAAIPLNTPMRGVIGIAEGIETALAAACGSGVPTVAAYCAGALAAWCWPVSVSRVVIFADNDRAGREAAEGLQARVVAAGLRCDVRTPGDDGADWADVWAQRGGEQ